jgi:hypothetical protein
MIAGTLVVSKTNPRYFTVASGDPSGRKVVYLTGSHLNNNAQDGLGLGAECGEPPEVFDYAAYLTFLTERGHNFIRLWRWEHVTSRLPGGVAHLCMSVQPWPRTGAGTARDGQPRFDLSRFDDAYFTRLRDRVVAAGDAGIYVGVMLFEGFGLHLSDPPDNVMGHPFHAENNVNGIGITSIRDYQVLPIAPGVRALQEAYLRKLCDTVGDLPNVLYEVVNESSGDAIKPGIGDSTPWQHWVIDYVRRYEKQQGYDAHALGMTSLVSVADQGKVNEPLFTGPADWVSPGFDDEHFTGSPGEEPPGNGRWFRDPPPNDGRKVVLSDTDHYAPLKCDALWAWKSFVRGHNPLLYDLGLIRGVNPPDRSAGPMSFDSYEPTRYAMGDTRRYAERMDLVSMTPRGDLASTGYALVNPGEEYLVLQPSAAADPFTVDLAAGTYAVEWYGVSTRETVAGDDAVLAGHGSRGFRAPFAEPGPSVLYLARRDDR